MPSRSPIHRERAVIARRLGPNLHAMSEASDEGERWLGRLLGDALAYHVWGVLVVGMIGGTVALMQGGVPTPLQWAAALGAAGYVAAATWWRRRRRSTSTEVTITREEPR